MAKTPPPPPKPGQKERYFYFHRVSEHDSLFIEVTAALLGRKPGRNEKLGILRRLQELGVFLIDVKLDPDDGSGLEGHITTLIQRCRRLRPKHVVLISTPVFDAAYRPLTAAGIPVVDARIDFPGSGRQKEFRRKFPKAMAAIGWPTRGLGEEKRASLSRPASLSGRNSRA